MAQVFLAVVRGLGGFNKLVVIKRLESDDPSFRRMFLDEARVAAMLSHPNVVHTYEVSEYGGSYFIAMEYLDGQPLNKIVRRAQELGGFLKPRLCARVVADALAGLHYAHELKDFSGALLNVVHRDVSPHNLFVTHDGQVKVFDFGVAKAESRLEGTDTGVLKGKLGYMAPEQLRLEAVDRRTDVFTAGVVLWEMLTGKRLFSGDTLPLVAEQMANAEREIAADTRPEIPDGLRQIALQALAGDAQRRFRTAWEMAAAIAAVVPPATSLEVRAWVTELAGPALRERAERLAALEALSGDELPKARPVNAPSPERAAALSAGEITPSAVSLPLQGRMGSRGQAALLFAAIALAVLVASGVFMAGKQLSASAAPRPSLAASAAAQLPSSESPAGNPILAVVHAAVPAEAPSSAAQSVDAAPPHTRAAPATAAIAAHHPRAAAPAQASCEVPFVIDASGVKRFKPECF